MIIYINNILIYLETKEEYIKYIRAILRVLTKVRLRIKFKKLVFYIKKVNFLKYVIISKKIKIKRNKINKISF